MSCRAIRTKIQKKSELSYRNRRSKLCSLPSATFFFVFVKSRNMAHVQTHASGAHSKQSFLNLKSNQKSQALANNGKQLHTRAWGQEKHPCNARVAVDSAVLYFRNCPYRLGLHHGGNVGTVHPCSLTKRILWTSTLRLPSRQDRSSQIHGSRGIRLQNRSRPYAFRPCFPA